MFERIGPEFQCSTGQEGGGGEFQCLNAENWNSSVSKEMAGIPMLIKIGPEFQCFKR